MKKFLLNILQGLDYKLINGNIDKQIQLICNDSRKCVPGSLFVAIKGTNTDGHQFIPNAIEKGAVAIIVQDNTEIISDATIIKVKDTKEALAIVSANFFNKPANKLKIIGITGTNGKTTTATLLYHLFRQLGFNCGLISTVEIRINDKVYPANMTTPDAITLQHVFWKMANNNTDFVFMEVSSHALEQKRVFGINFLGAVFTNITHDHLDYHLTFKNYLNAKKILFDNLDEQSFALINIDDKHSDYIVQNTKAKVFTYSLKSLADFKAKIIEKTFEGTLVLIDNQEVWFKFIGEFNVYNLLAVYSVARILNFESTEILRLLSGLNPVKGRLDTVFGKGIYAFVDYAHTPDALQKVLKELKNIKKPAQRIITVVGAGGNRDKEKRPKMAAIGQFYSDLLILTSDNPRYEDPENILNDMLLGIEPEKQNVIKITDRKQAIKTAVLMAKKGDIILVAGKGHENYQEINGKKYHFDDKEILSDLLLIN